MSDTLFKISHKTVLRMCSSIGYLEPLVSIIFLYYFNSMIQKILEHVITAVPASGLQVLPMATLLAQNLVKGSSELEKAKDNGLSAIEFLSKLLSILASEVPGARKDVETLPWKELPLIPVAQEIRKPS